MIVPVRRTTPRKLLEVIYNILPLDLQGKMEAILTQKHNKSILKLSSNGLHPDKKTYMGHRKYWMKQIQETKEDPITTDKIKEINPI